MREIIRETDDFFCEPAEYYTSSMILLLFKRALHKSEASTGFIESRIWNDSLIVQPLNYETHAFLFFELVEKLKMPRILRFSTRFARSKDNGYRSAEFILNKTEGLEE